MPAYDQMRAARVLALAAFTALATLAGVSRAGPPGTLANVEFDGQPMKSLFFFAGEWREARNGPHYDGPNGPFLPASTFPCNYSIFPKDGHTHGGWSSDPATRDLVLNGILGTGTNVVNMSYWGPPDTDIWGFYAPMQTAHGAHDQLFDAAVGKPLLIAPYIEDYAATNDADPDPEENDPVVQTGCAGEVRNVGQSPGFSFPDDFPGTADHPAPELVRQIVLLVNRYLVNPRNPEWKKKWAQMYDRNGEPRYIVSLIHVGSNQQPPPSPDDPHAFDRTFALGFGWVAREVEEQTGVRVGFTLDLLPPEHPFVKFKASVEHTAPELAREPSVLAIQSFIPEIHTGRCKPVDYCNDRLADDTDPETPLNQMITWKSNYISSWVNAANGSIPVILDVSAGYDAYRIFGPEKSRYGNNDRWRAGQKEMLSLRIRGVTGNAWNAYTEGSAIAPHCAFPSDLPSPGVPNCDGPPAPYPELRTTYDWFTRLDPPNARPARLASTLAIVGPTEGAWGDRAALKFKLTQGMIGGTPPENAIIPLSNRPVRIRIGDRTPVPGTTDDNGIVTAFFEPDQQPGTPPVPLVATFDGDPAYLSIETTQGFVVTKEKTLVRWFSGQNASTSVQRVPLLVTLAAILAEDDGPVLTKRQVSFTVGTGTGAPSCIGITDSDGIARCVIPVSQIPRGNVTVYMNYAGDAYYESADWKRFGPLLPGCTPPPNGECPD